MNIEQAAQELNQLQIDHAKALTRTATSPAAGGEIGVLLWLKEQQNEVFAIDIIEHFGLTPGRVANILKRLEEKKFIERRHNTEDLRKTFIRLTESGMQFAEEQFTHLTNRHTQLFSALGEEDTRHTLRILRKIIAWSESGTDFASIK